MGSCGEDPNKGIDSSVGGLVWVRRRNGSWWPGRIVGPDELPEGCVPTPRAGTPVKLLGREDASVDWYNLEKSKRVKPFRCGEYEDCIEKAKESASHVSKKAVKYARREEAILHALQLESARLAKDYPDFSKKPNPQDDRQSPSSVHPTELSEDIGADLRHSALELSRSGVSLEEPKHLSMIEEESNRKRSLNDPEDDGIEGVKRMRGLEDLGMGTTSLPKGKRSPVARVNELLKRRCRRCTLTKVLECTETIPALPIPTMFGVPEASESKEATLEGQSWFGARVTSNKEHNGSGSGSASSGNNDVHNITHRIEKGAAEWQLKGKRNTRSRKIDVDDEADTNAAGVDAEMKPLGARLHLDANQTDGRAPLADISGNKFSGVVIETVVTPPEKRLTNRQSGPTAAGSSLYDVTVVVETSHRPQHVPYISLMSKIYGRPVIGHPVTIKILDDGFCDELLGLFGCHSNDSKPRPTGKSRKLAGNKAWMKSAKLKKNPLLSKKIRRLSSLTSGIHGGGQETKKLGVVEKLKLSSPTIACVPLNVVFSRINAALNGGGGCGSGSLERLTGGEKLWPESGSSSFV